MHCNNIGNWLSNVVKLFRVNLVVIEKKGGHGIVCSSASSICNTLHLTLASLNKVLYVVYSTCPSDTQLNEV